MRPCWLLLAALIAAHCGGRGGILRAAERESSSAASAPRFTRHVIPVFSRLGCNAGACHGAVQGQNGFRLSLFGVEPTLDHVRLVRDFAGRRLNLLDPDASLLLLKATGQVAHRGGARTQVGSPEYQIMRAWITAGAPLDDADRSLIEQLSVTPPQHVGKPGQSYPLRVSARFSDGSTEDVTELCTFESGNKDVAEVEPSGQVKLVGVGDAPLVVRFRTHPAMAAVLVPGLPLASFPAVEEVNFIDRHVLAKLRILNIAPSETCDDATFLRRASLDVAGQLPTPEEVRAFLADADPNKRTKKIDELLQRPGHTALWATRLCDILKPRISYQDFTHRPANGATRLFYEWIRARLVENTPYDELAARMLLATSLDGRPREEWIAEGVRLARGTDLRADVADAAYSQRQTLDLFWHRFDAVGVKGTVQFAHAFLGLRLQCAQCHRHPSDVWTQDDLLSLSNFFMRIRANTGVTTPQLANTIDEQAGPGLSAEEKKQLEDQAKQMTAEAAKLQEEAKAKRSDKAASDELLAQAKKLTDQAGGYSSAAKILEASAVFSTRGNPFGWASVTSPLGTQQSETFRLLGQTQNIHVADDQDPRQILVDWLRRPDNPFFARAIVNRVWAHYFGRGIVDPPDDLSPLNPATHPELLAELAAQFVAHKYDLRWLHRTILESHTYQLSARTNESNYRDSRNYASFYPRRMAAEVLVDALNQATGTTETYNATSAPAGATALEVSGTVADEAVGNIPVQQAFVIFGRPGRYAESLCDCDREDRPSLVQSLYLANHPQLLKKITAPTGRLAQILKEQSDDAARIDEIFLWTLSRLPTDEERATALAHVAESSAPAKGYEGLLWGLVNTREFVLNH